MIFLSLWDRSILNEQTNSQNAASTHARLCPLALIPCISLHQIALSTSLKSCKQWTVSRKQVCWHERTSDPGQELAIKIGAGSFHPTVRSFSSLQTSHVLVGLYIGRALLQKETHNLECWLFIAWSRLRKNTHNRKEKNHTHTQHNQFDCKLWRVSLIDSERKNKHQAGRQCTSIQSSKRRLHRLMEQPP